MGVVTDRPGGCGAPLWDIPRGEKLLKGGASWANAGTGTQVAGLGTRATGPACNGGSRGPVAKPRMGWRLKP